MKTAGQGSGDTCIEGVLHGASSRLVILQTSVATSEMIVPLQSQQVWREVAERLEKGLPYRSDVKCPLHAGYRAVWITGDWYLCRSPACSFAFRNRIVESPQVEW